MKLSRRAQKEALEREQKELKDRHDAVWPQVKEILTDFCMDVTLNLGWYERAILVTRLQQWAFNLLILGFGAGSLYLMVKLAKPDQNVAFAQAGILLGCFLAVLQVMASVIDTKARLVSFRKASSELKIVLYGFEDTWYPKADFSTPEALSALREDVEKARDAAKKIEQDERDAYFASLKSPADLLASVTAAIDVVRGKRADYQAAVESAQKDALPSMLQTMKAAVANLQAAQAKLATVKDKSPAEQEPFMKEVVEAQRKLDAAMEGLSRGLNS